MWTGSGSPGRFQPIIVGRTPANEFGATGAYWHWQDGGSIELENGGAEVRLHDLTGFYGR